MTLDVGAADERSHRPAGDPPGGQATTPAGGPVDGTGTDRQRSTMPRDLWAPAPATPGQATPPDQATPTGRASVADRNALTGTTLGAGGHLRWTLPLLVILFAAGLRFAYLPHPDRIYFDETYYATNAAQLLEYGVEADPRVEGDPTAGVDAEFVVHPPVGKWLIAAGIAIFGDNAVGWRFAPAVAGTALVAVTYFIGLRLFRRRGVAALAAFLLSVEGLALTMSRISMLDAFLALFVALAAWALLVDRDRRWAAARGERADARGPFGTGPHVWLAGLALGLAVATKWSGVLAIGAAGLFVLASEIAWARATGRWRTALMRMTGAGVAALLVVPAIVYVASYGAWFANYERTRPGASACVTDLVGTPSVDPATCDFGPRDIARGWIDEQVAIYEFHRELEVTHSYRASALLWPVTGRPVVYYYEACLEQTEPSSSCSVPPGTLEEIVGLGNPAVWWLALGVYPFLAFAALWRRDRVAATILLFILAQYLPWLGQRPLFYFYALPLVPFVTLALGWAAARLLPRRGVRWVPIGAAALALSTFVFFAPLYYGMRIDKPAWQLRIWFDSWI